jgi:Phage integrase family
VQDRIMRKYIRPVAQRLGIQKRFGWHTFRHTYSTLLRSVGTEFKVMQELLRHSSFRSTLDVYTQAVTPAKARRTGRCSVAGIFLRCEPRTILCRRRKRCQINDDKGSAEESKKDAKRAPNAPFRRPRLFQ